VSDVTTVVVSESLGDGCPTFRRRVVVSSPKEEKTRKNDFMELSTTENEITIVYRNVRHQSPSNM
jgi:hypothetical protein